MWTVFFLLALAFALLYAAGLGRVYYRGPETAHFDGKRFFNPGFPTDKSRADLIRWRLTGRRAKWPDARPHRYPPQPSAPPPERVDASGTIRVTYIGQATFLIQAAGVNILTDPFLSSRASPLPFMGPRRVRPLAIPFADLPRIDLVLVSHNHYDHLDRPALGRLYRRDEPLIVTPLGNDRIIGLPGIRALDWGQDAELNSQPGSVRVTLEPALHWSARGLYDRRRALWGAFVIATPAGMVYFAGDTAYGDGAHFRAIREKHGVPALALLPVGAYEPRWFMGNVHMNPADAVAAWRDLGAPRTLGMHFGTIQLTDEGIDAPADDLRAALAGDAQAAARFHLPPFGMGLEYRI